MRIRILANAARPTAGSDVRHGEPLTFGIPLPRGTAQDGDAWILSAEGREPTAVQTRVMDRWPDGSHRWLLVDTQADLDLASVTEFVLESSPDPPAPRRGRIAFSETSGTVLVDTGAARFSIRPGGAFPFDGVHVGNDPVLRVLAGRLAITDADGVACETTIEDVAIEERGPLRGAISMTGTVRRAATKEFLLLSVRVHFFAGLPTVRLQVCLTNPNRARHRGGFWDLGDAGSVFLKDASLTVTLDTSDEPVSVYCAPELDAPWERYDAPFELYQDSSGGENWKSPNHVNRLRQIPNTFRGYRVVSGKKRVNGLRATPVVAVRQGSRQIAATIPHFWQNFPKAIEVSGSSMTMRLFPRQYADVHELQAGEQKTHECFLSFADDGVTEQPLRWCRDRAVVAAHPDWCLSTEAVPFLTHLDQDHLRLVNAAVDESDGFERKREVIDEYGWRHFGDIYGDHEAVIPIPHSSAGLIPIRHEEPTPLVSHYNNLYDPIAGAAYQFLRTADPRWWRLMTELAAHVVDIDVYHTVRDKWAYNQGFFWHTYHYGDADTATHRTYPRSARGRIQGGGPSADNNYTTGLMLHYFLTGDEPSHRTVTGAADYVIALDNGRLSRFAWFDSGDTGRANLSAPGYYGPGRSPANSLNALIDGHRVSGENRFLQKAEQLIRRVIHPDDDIARLTLDVREQRWFYTMFLQSLGKYLQYKAERGELDRMYGYACASLLHYARWMATHESPALQHPERLQFPTETWAAHETRKSDAFYLAALHATGDERGRFIERGEFFFRTAVDTLRKMPTRTLARPVVIMMTSGLLHSWFRDHPGAQAPARDGGIDFGAPQLFVPQKARAKRRLLWLGAGAGALAIALLGLEPLVGVAKMFVPGSIPFLLLGSCCGMVLLILRKKARSWTLAGLTALGLTYLLLSMPLTANRLASGLYGRAFPSGPLDVPDATTVVVFAGDHGWARIQEAARLYALRRPQWVVVSSDQEFRDALAGAGVPMDHILWEGQSATTREQVLNLAPLLDRYGIETVILVASPLHMPRALGACLALGVRAVPSPSALPHASVVTRGFRATLPSREALRLSWESIYEYLALAYYRARGWLAPSNPRTQATAVMPGLHRRMGD